MLLRRRRRHPRPAGPTSQYVFAGAESRLTADGDFVELANLNGSQVACRQPGGDLPCSEPQVDLRAVLAGRRHRPDDRRPTSRSRGAPRSRGVARPITGYTATAYDAPIGGNAIAVLHRRRRRPSPAPSRRGIGAQVLRRGRGAATPQGTSGPSWRVLAAPRTVPSAPGSRGRLRDARWGQRDLDAGRRERRGHHQVHGLGLHRRDRRQPGRQLHHQQRLADRLHDHEAAGRDPVLHRRRGDQPGRQRCAEQPARRRARPGPGVP